LKKAFSVFNVGDTVNWFESRGVKLKTEPDNRMFPVTNNSQTIIDCLVREAGRTGIKVKLNSFIKSINQAEDGFRLRFEDGSEIYVNKVIVATGGSSKKEGFGWLAELNHTIEAPVPSLFTFNVPNNPATELMGVSVENATVKIQSTKLKQDGPLLITHWGLSGPAVLKLSSWGARILNEMNYHFKVNISWNGGMNEQELRTEIAKEFHNIKRKKISNAKPIDIPSRLWLFLIHKCRINPQLNWADVSKENLNRLINALTNDEYEVKGKTTFKEEFVTCGGVSLQNINFSTMESNVCRGMYFAGEVLDIDAITGGFNFQAAWTTGFIAGKLMSQ
ncbi:MAG TPA: NAD(P)/FAD-dependent oxidoreductase, partial [Bacteroidia bacterium]|nr:NAD(P)/FAD-dependent oxidoreductase [Bacteroidia bacterium]